MITGKIMFDVEINCNNEASMDELSIKIEKLVKGCDNQVLSCKQVDSDVSDDSDE